MNSRRSSRFVVILLASLLLVAGFFFYTISISPPNIDHIDFKKNDRKILGVDHYVIGKNWIKKNDFGFWEMYVEGDAYERGLIMGELSKELLDFQEEAFMAGIQEILPSKTMMHFLKFIVAWKNRDLDEYIPTEFQKEIYGISKYASDEFDYIGPKFQRKLFYHAAHDIGHTVQNMGLVGCSAFSAWGERTNGGIVSARNFDFYVGDAFRRNKLLLFMRPDRGHAFASYSWPGMIGVLSGMNEKGLSLSLNAGPPEMPGNAKTPVSILAREILQYASNISEAIAIAEKREVFVSESFMISSADDNMSVVIEKSPEKMAVLESNEKLLLSTNHFQSPVFEESESNVSFQKESSTKRRLSRLNSLISEHEIIELESAVNILRDWDTEQEHLGIGNEESINMMLSHHSIVFLPNKRKIWVSTGSSQMDAFVGFDLKKVFSNDSKNIESINRNSSIPHATWLNSRESADFEKYRMLVEEMKTGITRAEEFTEIDFIALVNLNPDLYVPYMIAGKYFADRKECQLAKKYLDTALDMLVPWKKDIIEMEALLKNCEN